MLSLITLPARQALPPRKEQEKGGEELLCLCLKWEFKGGWVLRPLCVPQLQDISAAQSQAIPHTVPGPELLLIKPGEQLNIKEESHFQEFKKTSNGDGSFAWDRSSFQELKATRYGDICLESQQRQGDLC